MISSLTYGLFRTVFNCHIFGSISYFFSLNFMLIPVLVINVFHVFNHFEYIYTYFIYEHIVYPGKCYVLEKNVYSLIIWLDVLIYAHYYNFFDYIFKYISTDILSTFSIIYWVKNIHISYYICWIVLSKVFHPESDFPSWVKVLHTPSR